MSVFVDTGLFSAHHDRDATRHEIATAELEPGDVVQGSD